MGPWRGSIFSKIPKISLAESHRMIIRKITEGYVIQTYDTELGRFVSQEFVAGAHCEYEDVNGERVGSAEMGDPESCATRCDS